jgi:hypothetical protein
MTGPPAALAPCGIGLGGDFTLETDFDLAAGRDFALALPDFERVFERTAGFLLALPFAFVNTDRFLFICLWDFDFRDLADVFGLRADRFLAIDSTLRRGWMRRNRCLRGAS